MNKFGSIYSYDQRLWLNDRWVSGVNSIDAEFSVPNEQVNSIGVGHVNSFRVGEFQGSFAFSKYIFGPDLFYSLLQSDSINGLIEYKGKVLGIKQGLITNYSCRGSVNSIVESSISGVVFGTIGGSNFDVSPNSDEDPYIQTMTHANVNISSSDGIGLTNRIQSFSVEIEIPRQFRRVIGQRNPVQDIIVYPIVCSVEVSFDVHDYVLPVLGDFHCNEDLVGLEIDLKDCDDDTIQGFNFGGGKITNVSSSSSLDEKLAVSVRYESLLNDIGGLI